MIIPSGYAQVTWFFGGDAIPLGAACTLGVDLGGYTGTAPALAQIMFDAWENNLSPRQTQETTLERCLVKYGPNETGLSAEVSGTAIGGVTSGPASPNVAYLVQKQTNSGGRRGRGRMYIPGVAEAAIGGDGALTAAFLGQLQTSLDDFAVDVEAAPVNMVLFHSTDTPGPFAITALTASGMAATQRRRMRR